MGLGRNIPSIVFLVGCGNVHREIQKGDLYDSEASEKHLRKPQFSRSHHLAWHRERCSGNFNIHCHCQTSETYSLQSTRCRVFKNAEDVCTTVVIIYRYYVDLLYCLSAFRGFDLRDVFEALLFDTQRYVFSTRTDSRARESETYLWTGRCKRHFWRIFAVLLLFTLTILAMNIFIDIMNDALMNAKACASENEVYDLLDENWSQKEGENKRIFDAISESIKLTKGNEIVKMTKTEIRNCGENPNKKRVVNFDAISKAIIASREESVENSTEKLKANTRRKSLFDKIQWLYFEKVYK